MKAYKIELLIIDFDGIGPDEVKSTLENTRYPNRCIAPFVMNVTERDIGRWGNDHPLNYLTTMGAEYRKLFN